MFRWLPGISKFLNTGTIQNLSPIVTGLRGVQTCTYVETAIWNPYVAVVIPIAMACWRNPVPALYLLPVFRLVGGKCGASLSS
jgi:hypothetical protein